MSTVHNRVVRIALLLLLVSNLSIAVYAGAESSLPGTAPGQGAVTPDTEEEPLSGDAGVEDGGAGVVSVATPPPETEPPPDKANLTAKDTAKDDWRRDPRVKRHSGSYLGGGIGYTMAHAWYDYEQRDYHQSYAVGPVHGTGTYLRAGDAFFEWFAVGFQVKLISGGYGDAQERTSGFGLFLDTTFYPVKGFGVRPSLGVGFAYTQAGPEEHKFGFGGPLHLGFSLSYEFRLTRLVTMGPLVQISWVTGEQYDATFLTIGIEILKWFMTAEG